MANDHQEISVALLRGINVGGKNLLPMVSLKEIFASAGCTHVKNYIQSGNVVFQPPADLAVASDVASVIRSKIEARFALKVPVILRTATEMQRAIAQNPFLKAGVDAGWMHIMFLEHKPTTEQVAALDHDRSPGDEFVVAGREIYLHLPNGVAKTKLTNAYFDSKLTTTGTQRNWRTVLTLAEMMNAAGLQS